MLLIICLVCFGIGTMLGCLKIRKVRKERDELIVQYLKQQEEMRQKFKKINDIYQMPNQ